MSRRRARGDAYGAAQGIPQGTPQATPGVAPNAIPGAAPRATSRPSARAQPRANIDGSLCDHPVRKLFDVCQRQRVTGVLQLVSWGRRGRVELRAGRIMTAAYGTVEGNGAVSELLTLRDGMFELRQELPSLPAGRDAGPVGFSAIAEQCRERALSCRIHALSLGQRAAVTYRGGELERAEIDGATVNIADSANVASALAPFEQGELQIEALPILLHERAVTAPTAVAKPDPQPARRPSPAAPAAPVRPAPVAHAQRQAAPAERPPTAAGEIAARADAAGESRGRASTSSGEVVAGSVAVGEIVARPSVRPRPPPPPPRLARPAQLDGVPAGGGMRPWLPDPSTSGAAANWQDPPSIRREVNLPAILAVLAVSLLLILGFVALQP
jgi:hypothetical protein